MSTHPALTGEPWFPTIETFGARLALMRQAMGWNIARAAKECGIAEGTWREWEQDLYKPRNMRMVAEQISAATGITTSWLHGRNPAVPARAKMLRARRDSNPQPSDPKVDASRAPATRPRSVPQSARLTPDDSRNARPDISLGGAA